MSGNLDRALTELATLDELKEYADLGSFPVVGSADVMYIALDTNKAYRWETSEYVTIATGGAVDSVNSRVGNVVLTKTDVGLSNVDNTSDLDKPISTSTSQALATKAGLSDDNTLTGNNTFSGSTTVDTFFISENALYAINSADMMLFKSNIDGRVGYIPVSDVVAWINSQGGIDADTINNGLTVQTSVPLGAVFTDTVYTHPSTHPATMITEDTLHRFITDSERTIWNDGSVNATSPLSIDGFSLSLIDKDGLVMNTVSLSGFVDILSNQVIGGEKTFSGSLVASSDFQSNTLTYTRSKNLVADTDLNTITTSGFYDINVTNAITANTPNTGWHYLRVQRHTNDNGYVYQELKQFSGEASYFRTQSAGVWGAWTQLLDSNDVIDADTVDGLNTSNTYSIDTIAVRDGAGNLSATLFRSNYATGGAVPADTADFCFRNDPTTDDYLRFCTQADLVTYLKSGGLIGNTGDISKDFSVSTLILLNNEGLAPLAGQLWYDINDSNIGISSSGDTAPAGLFISDGAVVNTIWHTGHFLKTDIDNWNTAYSWGDHSIAGYVDTTTAQSIDGNKTFTGLLKSTKGLANALTLDGTIAQNAGIGFDTDGVDEWFLYRSTVRDLLLSARNTDNLGATLTAMRANWNTGIVDFPQGATGVDGNSFLTTADASVNESPDTIVQRDASGYVHGSFFNMSANQTVSTATRLAVETGTDNYLRWQTPAQFITNHAIAQTTDLTDGSVTKVANNVTNITGNIAWFVNDGGGNLGMRFNATAGATNTLVENGIAYELQVDNDSAGGDFAIFRGTTPSGLAGETITWGTAAFAIDGATGNILVGGTIDGVDLASFYSDVTGIIEW